MSAAQRPASATAQWVSLTGAVGFVIAAMATGTAEVPLALASILCALATAGPMIAFDLLVHRVHLRPSTGLRAEATALAPRRIALKLAGFYATIGLLALAYHVIPEYEHKRYEAFWAVVSLALPTILVGAVPYFAWVDRHQIEPRDRYWHMGSLLLGRLEDVDRAKLRQHALGWIIKGFYLPLMVSYFTNAVRNVWRIDHTTVFAHMPDLVTAVSRWSLALDLAFVVIGYTLTLRILDSHIRSSNPFMYGWVATLILYQPFWGLIGKRYFAYNDGSNWADWFGDHGALLTVWGIAIILSKAGWAWANISFGCRFSNLTNRGVLTSGPYRFTKHPSYVCKNVSWWLLSVPFLSQEGPVTAAVHCGALLGVNLLYVIRAHAEEQHLSEDPRYVSYALWMEEHGVFRFLGRALPALRYRPPDAGYTTTPDHHNG